MNAKILMVDDDRQLSVITKEYLEAKGMNIHLVHSGDEGLSAFIRNEYDFCILDIRMPLKDGYTLAGEIRELNTHVPIIFLTGLDEKQDKIKGLTIGVDDYITKPFSMEELSLRINNILKRSGFAQEKKALSSKLTIGKYTLDPISRELTGPLGLNKLTAIESKLLYTFFENVNEVLGRDLALKKIWGDEHFLHGRSLNVYVSKLRQFLKEDSNIEILNVHGVGYKLILNRNVNS